MAEPKLKPESQPMYHGFVTRNRLTSPSCRGRQPGRDVHAMCIPGWGSGETYALTCIGAGSLGACKSLYAGSIPAAASSREQAR